MTDCIGRSFARLASSMVLEREEPGSQPKETVTPPEQNVAAEHRAIEEFLATLSEGKRVMSPAAHLLVVDDELEIRAFIRGALEDEGLDVDLASNGREALAHASRFPPALVILDMMLPDVNGEDLARTLHERLGPDLPILVITADGHAAEKAHRSGAFAYLEKPFQLDDLVDIVLEKLNIA